MERLPAGTTSERLTIRLWRVDEAEALSTAINQSLAHLQPWMDWAASPASPDRAREVIESSLQRWRDGADATYGVFAGDEIVGGTGLHRRAGPDTLEIGYWIHVDHIGRGYATELAAALTDLALGLDGIEHVEIHHDEANVRSAAVPRKLGFQRVATGPREPLAPGHSGTEWSWRTTRTTWRAPRIEFAGRSWWVKCSSNPVGPGGNRFDDSPEAVSVDGAGLRLRIRRDDKGWTCAEIVGEDDTGYGNYEWTVATDLRGLEPQIVLGMFTWSDAGVHHHRELDIEVSGAFGGVKFVVQPDRELTFPVPDLQPWTCTLDWAPGRATFRAAGGEPWTVSGAAVPPPGGAHPRINLWLFGGREPTGDDPIEVHLTDFRFTPR